MSFLRKFLPLLFFILIAIFISLVGFGYFSIHRIPWEKSGTVTVAGLDDVVVVERDAWGIPHLSSRSDRDLFFAMGFVEAQERLWQMDLFRRAACGTLAEILGERAIILDEWTRTIGFLQIAEQIMNTLTAETRQLLDAYAAGINACLQASQPLPLECSLLRYQPQPWKPQESLAMMRLFGWMLSMGWHIDPVLGEVMAAVGREKMQRLCPGLSAPVPEITAPIPAELYGALQNVLGYVPNGLGSNAWVVAGHRCRNGSAILANDTHLPFTTPALYYLLHLRSPGFKVIGAAFPGLPGVVLGRNETIAWGVTHGMIDDIDFIQIQADSVNPGRFLYNGQPLDYTVREERISVRGGKEVTLRIRSTPWGPLMPVSDSLRPSIPMAMLWTGLMPSDELTAFTKIMAADNWYTFRDALRGCKTPGENFFYADRNGMIGYQLAASVPVRTFSNPLLPASDSLHLRRWQGEVPFSELPTLVNPSTGFIANANQQVRNVDSNYHLSDYWDPPYRYQRVVNRLDSLPRISAAEARSLQIDDYNGHAAWFVPLVLSSLSGYSALPDSPELYAKEMLEAWDFHQSSESIAATLYEMIYVQVFRKTMEDELGEAVLQRFMAMPRINVTLLDGLIAAQDSAWFDDGRTAAVEDRQQILAASFFSAVDSLKQNIGANIGEWWWGNLHTVSGFHPFTLRPSIGRFFVLPETAMPGGNFTIHNGTFLYTSPFKAFVGPCIRQVVDLSTTDYQVVLYSGQSGHPFSRHYQDQNGLWRQGKLITLSLDPAKQDRSSWTSYKLLPRR